MHPRRGMLVLEVKDWRLSTIGQADKQTWTILCADWNTMDLCASALHQRKLPFNVRKRSGDYNPAANAIQIMTMKVSKGLEFPVVALPGVGHMPAKGEDEQVKRNRDRFPSDFLFQLTADEKTEVVANCDHLQNLKFSKALPFAFTEHGAIQAANVLASSQAVEMGIYVVRAFVQLRQLLDAVRELTAPPEPPKRPIGFLTHEDKKTPKASTLTKGRKAP